MTTVAVIDYGMGNLRSVCKAIEHVAPRARVQLTTATADIRAAARVVFPGQGAIGACMTALEGNGLRDSLLEAMKTKPFLGICLGLQALYDFSEEGGGTPGLSLLAGAVKRFPVEKMTDKDTGLRLKVPHMGWNEVHQTTAHPMWHGIPQNTRFYFVHSYFVDSADPSDVAGETSYALRFTSAAARANIFAVQFHPEKSQRGGLRLLENFMSWDGSH
ncbi:MAG: imidazole glycerol phosphate synthase subunit HisH [Gammaproteobacteria bacterium]|nr:imidazole glycerol phosphate synthase subunit HisH [Gammaproteobacteria bacterium]MDH3369876.1 imidazole glycerol phosphate synthase subunit HisH [Gammaproteobacteria bacterium]MDH3405513.1 imidazole glycerol phosphate synthase subunit HisH [Gammaproteobacteria bacterium]MDH3563339.1 imidazole glycerol phosphate synthase subunit HisH [Gammaproteobacteria bacterium]MDH5486736.1 imidazole glycerol phosphate synthase subunit HisH [Gammaproteobacteria bacterium]